MSNSQAGSAAKQEVRKLNVDGSVLDAAARGDSAAIRTMFSSFIGYGENIHIAEYLGKQGLWWIGVRSFGAMTDKRAASIRIGAFGELLYQDALLSYINSSVFYQPSRLGLYILSALYAVASLAMAYQVGNFFAGFAILAIAGGSFPFIVKFYYMMSKNGLVFSCREGISVYMFADRKNIEKVSFLLDGLNRLRRAE